jgi:hypothetical protein
MAQGINGILSIVGVICGLFLALSENLEFLPVVIKNHSKIT